MEQIMEFFLNLLLFNGKFLTSAAAKTFTEAIKRCTEFNSRLSHEYQKSTNVLSPFENMLEMVNQSSVEYVGENCDNNLVISGEISCKLYEELNKIKQQQSITNSNNLNEFKVLVKDLPLKISKSEKPSQDFAETPKKTEKFSSKSSPDVAFIKYKHPHHDFSTGTTGTYIEENLTSILKAQEVLFKNIGKLVIYLEKQQYTNDLGEIKHKLVACAEILSNYPMAIESKYVNNLVDEEIAKCRFGGQGQGDIESKRIANHDLKSIEKDESRATQTQTPKRAKSLDVEAQTNQSQLLDINNKQFTRTEDNLIHESIKRKCLALKDDYLNRCRCAYHNKKHFKQFEAKLKRKVQRKKEETDLTKLFEVGDSAFEVVEKRVSFEENKREVTEILEINHEAVGKLDRKVSFHENIKEEIEMIAMNQEAVSKLEEKLIELEQRRKSEEHFQRLLEERQIMIRNSQEIINPHPNQGDRINLIDCRQVNSNDSTTEDKISLSSLEDDKKLLKVNEDAFKDLETTLKTSQILKVTRTKSNIKTSITDTKKPRFDQAIKKNLSTIKQTSMSHNDLIPFTSKNLAKRTIRDDGSEVFIETKGTILLKPKKEKPPLLLSKKKSKTFSKVQNFQANQIPLAAPKSPLKKSVQENFTAPMKLSEENKKSRGQLKPRTTKTAMKKMQVLSNQEQKITFPQVKPKTYQNLLSYRKIKARSRSPKIDKYTEKSEESINLIKWEEADSSTMSKVLCNQV